MDIKFSYIEECAEITEPEYLRMMRLLESTKVRRQFMLGTFPTPSVRELERIWRLGE